MKIKRRASRTGRLGPQRRRGRDRYPSFPSSHLHIPAFAAGDFSISLRRRHKETPRRSMKLGIPLGDEAARARVNMRRGDATGFVAHLLRQQVASSTPPRRAYGIPYNNPLSRRSPSRRPRWRSFRRFDPPFISRPLRSSRPLVAPIYSRPRFFYPRQLSARFPVPVVPCM